LKQTYYSNGKLLITGEYLVLDGANALALPTKFGQSLELEEHEGSKIIWKSLDEKEAIWFEEIFSIDEIASPSKKRARKDTKFTKRIIQILREAKKLNPDFLNKNKGYKITTKLDFPRDWGLGSSSTLINNIATWAKVDPFKLLEKSFGGSGYDIAAAQNNSPILYSNAGNSINVHPQQLDWNFTDQLFFVHLNRKQNSSDGIANYQKQKTHKALPFTEINLITSKICVCNTLSEFEKLITTHEEHISKVIQQKPIKEKLFSDYKGSIKSLGAWGGDFVLVTGNDGDMDYFRKKGFETILSFREMIL